MSTRSHIVLFDDKPDVCDMNEPSVILYRHSDGYPSGLIPDLVPILKEYLKYRQYNTCHLSARIIQHLCNNLDSYWDKHWKDEPKYKDEQYKWISYGISDAYHMDIEYTYCLFPIDNGNDILLQVYGTSFGQCERAENWKLIGEKKISALQNSRTIAWGKSLKKKCETMTY